MDKLKKICIYFLLLFLLQSALFAQNTKLILDRVSKQPIPYATVTCTETGFATMANQKGEWIFPDSIHCKTVTVSCAGYEKLVVASTEQRIILSPLIVHLQEVQIGGKEEELLIDNIEKLNCSYGFIPEKISVTYASYIANPAGTSGWIKELSFHVSSFHRPDLDVPVRIRFFEWNEQQQMPGKEISAQNFIYYPQKKGWNKIDMRNLQQEIPADGVVVAFELISAGPEHYHHFTFKDAHQQKQIGRYYGWNLTASCCTDCSIKGFHMYQEQWLQPSVKTDQRIWAPAVKLKLKYYHQ